MDTSIKPAAAPASHTPKAAARERMPEARTTQFSHVLKKATGKTENIPQPLPATLTGLVRPRSHIELTSLLKVQEPAKPLGAALEKTGYSRLLP